MFILMQGNCLSLMQAIPDDSIDLVLADPPYGTTSCKWDSIIPLEPMWKHLHRVARRRSAIVLTAAQPFTTALIASNMKAWRHSWIWQKERGVGFQCARFRPMMKTEDVCVFGKSINYYPQMVKRDKPITYRYPTRVSPSNPMTLKKAGQKVIRTHKFPTNIIHVTTERGYHPTQKPVALMEYLIKSYTIEGETVLDFTMGSGTTGVACANLNRAFIGIELDENYFNIAQNRIADAQPPPSIAAE